MNPHGSGSWVMILDNGQWKIRYCSISDYILCFSENEFQQSSFNIDLRICMTVRAVSTRPPEMFDNQLKSIEINHANNLIIFCSSNGAINKGWIDAIDRIIIDWTFCNNRDCFTSELHLAATRGHFDKVNQELFLGADIDQLDSMGCTPLYYAVVGGHINLTLLLLELGAKPTKYGFNRISNSPLFGALQRRSIDAVNALLYHGALDGDEKSHDWDLMLKAAYESEDSNILELLIKYKVNKSPVSISENDSSICFISSNHDTTTTYQSKLSFAGTTKVQKQSVVDDLFGRKSLRNAYTKSHIKNFLV
eukprot:gene8291-11221_t